MQENEPVFNKKILLSLILITSFINPFLAAAVNIALPKIAISLQMNAVSMSWVGMTFLLSSAVFLVPIGKLADMYGRKRVFMLGNMIITLATLLCAVSVYSTMLLISRLIQGIGSAMIFGTGMAIITSAFPPKERGKTIGMVVSAVYLGLSLAPILGGLLTQHWGWRSIFYVTIPIEIFVILAVFLWIKAEWADAKGEKFDLFGSIIYMLSMSAFMYGLTRLPDQIGVILSCAGFMGIIYFILLELRIENPVLNMRLFKNNRVFAFSNIAALINYAATFAIGFLLSLYLQYIKGLSPKEAGLILVTQPLVMTIFASFSGRLSDKYDSRILSSAGMAIIVVGLILLAFIDSSTSNQFLIASLVLLGMGFGLFSSPNTNSIMSSVEKKYLGVASATVGTMRMTGQMLSMGIATLLMHIFMGDTKNIASKQPQFMQSIHLAFVLFAVLCALGVFASLARGKKKVQVS